MTFGPPPGSTANGPRPDAVKNFNTRAGKGGHIPVRGESTVAVAMMGADRKPYGAEPGALGKLGDRATLAAGADKTPAEMEAAKAKAAARAAASDSGESYPGGDEGGNAEQQNKLDAAANKSALLGNAPKKSLMSLVK